MSKLYFRLGAMNSGKSTNLLQAAYNYTERGQRVIIAKPSIDTKSDKVVSRLGASSEVNWHVLPETDIRSLLSEETETVDCILVDEAQFLSPEQVNQLFYIAVMKDIPVLAYGIRTDFATKAFPGSLRLMELAHSLEELKTICRCGRKALLNGRKIDGVFVKEGSQVAIDGQQAEYESLCGTCYIKFLGWS
jgi:thymidine kinase